MDKIEKIKVWLKPYLEEDKVRNEHEEGFFHCAMLLNDFLDTLEEESDKSLDEAAEEWAKSVYGNPGLSAVSISGVFGFKAGAEWMARQGVSWEDIMTYYDGFLLYGKDERAFTMEEDFNEGDKVIVQIRKK